MQSFTNEPMRQTQVIFGIIFLQKHVTIIKKCIAHFQLIIKIFPCLHPTHSKESILAQKFNLTFSLRPHFLSCLYSLKYASESKVTKVNATQYKTPSENAPLRCKKNNLSHRNGVKLENNGQWQKSFPKDDGE